MDIRSFVKKKLQMLFSELNDSKKLSFFKIKIAQNNYQLSQTILISDINDFSINKIFLFMSHRLFILLRDTKQSNVIIILFNIEQ